MENKINVEIINKYLKLKGITPAGLFKKDLEDNNDKALIYVAYVIDKFTPNKKIEGKIKLLAEERGGKGNSNDVKRNYYNQLTEFHALYTLTNLMGFTFIDCDIPSDKHYADKNKNCDLLIKSDGNKYFAEVKNLSGEIMNTYTFRNHEHFTPKMDEDVDKWIKKMVKNADKKGADFLVLRIPTWNLFDATTENIFAFLQDISKDITLNDNKFFWNISKTHINKLVFIKAYGFWEVKITQ